MTGSKKEAGSKTMKSVTSVTIEYTRDESLRSEKRVAEATELIFQMLQLAKKRGRPAKHCEEVSDAA